MATAKKKSGRPAGKRSRARHLDNRDLAHKIQAKGFKAVADEIGDRMTPARAHKILELLTSYGYDDIDPELRSLAAQKRKGHFGGPVKPPVEGEVRDYVVGSNTRIGVPLGIQGKKPGDKAWVQYGKDQIIIHKRKPK